MTFQADYPDLTGLTVGQQIDELFNKFISLSRQVEYAVNHIDSKNLTFTFNKRLEDEAGNVSELMQTTEGLSLSIENKVDKTAAYYNFTNENFNIYNGGIKIFNGTPTNPGDAVFYADKNGILNLREIIFRDQEGTGQGYVSSSGAFFSGLRIGDYVENLYDDPMSASMIYAVFDYAQDSKKKHLVMKDGRYPEGGHAGDRSAYAGFEFYSSYQRTISSSTGIPSNTEKKKHSGITLTGDVVISNFNDNYYRYPVIGDANYKYRLYFEDTGTLVVARYNAKTNELIKACKYAASSIT